MRRSIPATLGILVVVMALPAFAQQRVELPFDGGRARFELGGLRVATDSLGRRTALSYRFLSATAGDTRIDAPAASLKPTRAAEVVFYERGPLIEAYRVVGGELEQYFILSTRPAAGDLVITGRATTALDALPSSPGEILLGRGRVAHLRIHDAVAIDAGGRRVDVAMSLDARRLNLTVPGAWLAEAAYPVVVDPLIGSTFPLDGSVHTLMMSDDRHGAVGGRFLAVEQVAAGAQARFIHASDGTPDGAPFSVPWAWDDGAYLASSDAYLVAICLANDVAGYIVDARSGAVTGPITLFTRLDTPDVSICFGSAVVAATAGGWIVGFTCESVDQSGSVSYATLSAECLKVAPSGSVVSGPAPLVLHTLTYNWDNDSHDWIYDAPHAALLHDDATNSDRTCMTWDDWADTGSGSTLYDIYAAVANATTMTLLRDWNPESVTIASTSTSLASLDTPDVAADETDNEFMIAWNRCGTAAYSNVKVQRFNASGAAIGTAFYAKGSLTQTTKDYSIGRLLYSPPGNQYLIAWNEDYANVYATTIAGGTVTVGADVPLLVSSASESCGTAAIDRADSHVLLGLNVGGTATGQVYEIQNVPPPLAVMTAALPDATVGIPYSQAIARMGGAPAAAWTLSAGSLPAGLVLDAATGVVQGTPTAAGWSAFTVQVVSGAETDTQALSIGVAAVNANGGSGGSGNGGKCSSAGAGAVAGWILLLVLPLAGRRS